MSNRIQSSRATARTRRTTASRRVAFPMWGDVDRILLAAVLALSLIGCVLIWSATLERDDLTGGDSRAFLVKQLINVVIGLGLMATVVMTDHRWVRILAPIAYLVAIAGLVLVLAMGSTINGSRSWLIIGGMSFQPSELAKLAVVVGMALVVAERSEGRWRDRVGTTDVLLMLVVAGVPAVLILAQPDLGTMLVLTATVFGVIAASGADRRWLGLLGAGGIGIAVFAVVSGFLKQYQVDRFLAFTNPDLDPKGAGYNVEQARIAVGNGGLFGQGLFDGSQTQSGFVPEQHTDFVFTVAGEELGLVGAAVIVALLGIVLWRSLRIATRTDDVFGRIAAAGIACWFGFQAFQNIGMCLGIMPVTGVPLPFVSYGGSSMFAGMLAVGLLQNIHLRTLTAPASRLAPQKRVLVRA
ncbi:MULTISPECIES: rod shape-determining protein RodA [unclassified Nocardioides]|jgi:rod shape determining protein RodA|uniref:rod shape-determining protein RodA n=1 Tax=unclassified Nocardioides TaxID=2615069 RepID=UPI00070377C6|nr:MULTISPECIES: rod shape-determining protein RodA [unclassified Nocardioides]KRC46364.1 rod shape-determining protein RodA [Nocardioides sp. Root79]KRC69711.1 rod shape-determining protein RodA [Nocardioides sp. Root240]